MPRWRDDPADVRPMLASLAEPPIAQAGWVYEPRYDGMRVLADLRPPARRGAASHVVLTSRNGRQKQDQFPAIRQALERLAGRLPAPVLIDGEIVAIDNDDEPLGFQQLQGRIHLTSAAEIAQAERDRPTAVIFFDLLRDGDEDLRGEPLAARRLRLQARIKPRGAARRIIRLSEIVADDGRPLLRRAREAGWEGLIGKDGRSPYQAGRRSPAWRKLKLLAQQEFVIGGWTEPRQSRAHLGALLVGYFNDRGVLTWAGSVGTGFDDRELARLADLLESRASRTSPFAGRVKTTEPAHWVRPDLVAEVRFTEWTADGLLRQPVYLGLRADKPAREVRREATGGRPANSRGLDPAPAPKQHAALLARLQELEDAHRDGDVELPGGDVLRVTNLWKVFWPDLHLTKGDLMRYYVRVSPFLLPAVADRPLVMRRFPNGTTRQAFYQQRHPDPVPAGVRRMVLPANVDPIDEDGPRHRLIGGRLTTLLYMTQLAAISQDPWFSRVGTPKWADYAALDLDPGEGTSFARVLDVARALKEELDRYGVPAVPKTSGASGLHIYVPLPAKTSYETAQLLCQVMATTVASRLPKIATVERMVRKRRPGTVYVDYLQNILGKTLATAYSARASDYAGVSTPVSWTEIAEGCDPRAFTIETAPRRFAAQGDLWRTLREGPAVDLKRVIARGRKGR